ncbi:MAG TPA: VOC family protein [Aliidongia sp.]|uniref:VOC family protein n=1 Tax=Aliidongia sp. TaxID=1914230 RepID=UPI002DDD4791|nr:VOC family protein [Aliidongia sp.]HEV2676519.1 VOC family protein [Aliidongia sp.]
MSETKGKFIWYDLMTTDTVAAEAFYKSVVGWSAQDAGTPGVAYTLFSVGAAQVGGMMAMPDEMRSAGAHPSWRGYVAVADVDASAAQVAASGGTIHRSPEDIPNVGRFAVAADPQGALFILFRGMGEAPPAPAPNTPGYVGWNELATTDWEAAFAFYSGLFGWAKGESFDMGPMGTYQLFTIGGVPAGGMMNKPTSAPVPYWLYYVNVDAIDAAAARVTAGGGKIVNGPHEVPGGTWTVSCIDPQGAMFALAAPRR